MLRRDVRCVNDVFLFFASLLLIMESFRFEDESPQTLVLLLTLNEVKPSPDREMVKFLTFDGMFCHHDILVKTRNRMTTATTFSRQNDVGSRGSSACTT